MGIVSYSEGRIRLRFNELKNPITAMAVKNYLYSVDGIKNVEIKILTGSILVEFDPVLLPTAKLFERGKEELAKHGIELEIPGLQPVQDETEM